MCDTLSRKLNFTSTSEDSSSLSPKDRRSHRSFSSRPCFCFARMSALNADQNHHRTNGKRSARAETAIAVSYQCIFVSFASFAISPTLTDASVFSFFVSLVPAIEQRSLSEYITSPNSYKDKTKLPPLGFIPIGA